VFVFISYRPSGLQGGHETVGTRRAGSQAHSRDNLCTKATFYDRRLASAAYAQVTFRRRTAIPVIKTEFFHIENSDFLCNSHAPYVSYTNNYRFLDPEIRNSLQKVVFLVSKISNFRCQEL
jgi:hypothetical protein